MAALPISDRRQSPATPRQMRRMNPHMDFTPMVDLGFLLITFFMLSTTLAKPQIMPLVMPDDDGSEHQALKHSKALTLLLGSENKVYWYEGLDMDKMDSTSFERDGLRQVILQKMDKVRDQFGLQSYHDVKTGEARQGSHLNIIIKPGVHARYKNLVDALDEMNICQIRYYCILDPSVEEAQKIDPK